MKRVLVFLFALILTFSAVSVSAYSVEDAYYEFKDQHGDFVKALTDYGIDEETIIFFLYDVYDYVLEIHSVTPVTIDNFESKALTAITRVSSREQYYPIQDALLVLYPDAIKQAVANNVVSDEFKPLVETVKKIIFNNGMLGTDTDVNTGTDNNGGSGETAPSLPSQTINFSDMGSSHWAYTAVSYLANNFILDGYLDGTFKPDANITRAEFAKIIVSATNTYDYAATSSFGDVSSDAWYYAYVSSALKSGYITGYPDGSFRPNANITRADICTIVYRCIKDKLAKSSSAPAFSDDWAIPSYAGDAVYVLAGNGIVNGIGDGTFAPTAFATRAQTSKIVYQALFAN